MREFPLGDVSLRKVAGVIAPHPSYALEGVDRPASKLSSDDRLKSLYGAHWQELCRYVRRTFGAGPPEPEDVAQIAFTRYATLEEPQRVRNPRAFLYATARNVVLDQKRAQDRVERYVQEVLARAGEDILDEISPERVLMERQRFELLSDAIGRLPLKQQQVLAMNRCHGMTYEAIAEETGWSLADISRQITRAVAALENALGEDVRR